MSTPVIVKGYNLADLSVGQKEHRTSRITIEDVDAFAALSGDISPVHMSEDFAKKRGLEGRIAHGLLLGAHVSALIGNQLPGRSGILQTFDLQFRYPLVPPETIEITGEVTNISLGTGQITLSVEVRNTAGKLIANCEAKSLIQAVT
jgi:3-hydroxybutyryl-CoA dehydratase